MSQSLTLFRNYGLYQTPGARKMSPKMCLCNYQAEFFCMPQENCLLKLCKIARTIIKQFSQEKVTLVWVYQTPSRIQQEKNKTKNSENSNYKCFIFTLKCCSSKQIQFHITLFCFFFIFQRLRAGSIRLHKPVNAMFS